MIIHPVAINWIRSVLRCSDDETTWPLSPVADFAAWTRDQRATSSADQ
jgi:hypothetical protein